MKYRKWWPLTPECVQKCVETTGPIVHQDLGRDGRSAAATVGTTTYTGGTLVREAAVDDREKLGASWWTPQRQPKRPINFASRNDHAKPSAADPALLNDSGPPTPESEDRTSSVLASATPHTLDAAPRVQCEGSPGGKHLLTSPYGGIIHQAAANAQKSQRLHVLYTGLFIDRQEQQKLFERVWPCHVNVTANHVTLAHKPSQVAPTLPLGKGFSIAIAGVVANDRTQVMSIQLPSMLSEHFAGAIPHVTVSCAAGVKAVEAGNLLSEVCSGSDCPVTMEVWHEPLVVSARVAAMLSNGELVFSHERLSEAINDSTAPASSKQAAESSQAAEQRRPLADHAEGSSADNKHRLRNQDTNQGRSSLLDLWTHGSKASVGCSASQADEQPSQNAAGTTCMDKMSTSSRHVDAQFRTGAAAGAALEDAEAEFQAIMELDALLSSLEHAAHDRTPASHQQMASTEGRQGPQASSRHNRHKEEPRGSGSLFSRKTGSCSNQTQRAEPENCPGFIRKRGMAITPQPPTVLEFEGRGSQVQSGLQTLCQSFHSLAAPASQSSAVNKAGQEACSRDAASTMNPTVPESQQEHERTELQQAQSQKSRQRGKGLLAASELATGTITGLVNVWNFAGGLSQHSQVSAEQNACNAPQPKPSRQTEDTNDSCDSFWDATGMSCSRGFATTLGHSKHATVQHAQSGTTGRQDWQSRGVGRLSMLGASLSTKAAASPDPRLVPLPQPKVGLLSPGQNTTSISSWTDGAAASPGEDTSVPLKPLSWPCQSEVLLQLHSSTGATAAVSAAQAAVARTMAERELARCLADAERRTSAVHRSARDVFSQAAAEAHQQGQRELARELVNKCREHEKLAIEARFRANEAAFDGSNCNLLNRWKVDLHGLHVDEALRVLETHLIALGGLGHPGGILLQVIVGLGRHSVGGVARILPAVVRYLTDAGYNFREEPNNAGVICVLLPGKRNALSGQINMTCNTAY